MDEKQKDEYIAYLEKIIALLPASIYWKNRQGQYLGCNNVAAKFVGLPSPKDCIGKNLHDLLDKKYADSIAETDERIMSNNQGEILEEVGINLQGDEISFLSHKIPLRDHQGDVIGLLGASLDITKQKKLETELKQIQGKLSTANQEKTNFINSMSYLENIIALIPGNVYWKDANGRYLGCNENVAKILKLSSRTEIVGKTNCELLGEEYAKLVEAIDEEVIRLNCEKVQEEIGFDADQNPAIYLTKKVPLHNEEGKVLGLLGISIDITQQKKIEQKLREAKKRAEAANQAKSEFLALISHELRMPLTGILGMAQLIQLDETPIETQEKAADILKSGEHLLSLVDDLLDLSKLEANKIELHFTPINLKTLIEETIILLTPKAKQQNLSLQTEYGKNVSSFVMSDVRALRQILLNLIGNAIKFTPKGYVSIKLNCIEQNSTHTKLQFIVEDTGIGIAQDKLTTIFERFNQADTSITRKYGGTGLGLAITKAYLELMNGNITVQSEVGKGSAFIFTIPFERAHATQHNV